LAALHLVLLSVTGWEEDRHERKANKLGKLKAPQVGKSWAVSFRYINSAVL